MTDAPRVHRYGEGEFMLAYGPKNGPQLLILQPLFEEMNRCRALVAAMCRALADNGIGCWLPDLPGTGESVRALETVGWQAWLDAVEQAALLVQGTAGSKPRPVAIRGGALLDHAIAGPRWRLSPTTGRSLLSDLRRSALVGSGDPTAPAGYKLSADMTKHLEDADVVGESHTVRITSDTRPADDRLDIAPLWRHPEPTNDADAVRLVSHDIVDWIGS